LKVFLGVLGVKQAVKSSSDMMPAVMRSSEKSGFLFVANYHQIPFEANYKIKLGNKTIILPSAGKLKLPLRSGRVLPLNYIVDESITILSTTVQILSITKSKGIVKIKIEATPDFSEEFSLVTKKVCKVYLNGKLVKATKANKAQAIKLSILKSENILTLK